MGTTNRPNRRQRSAPESQNPQDERKAKQLCRQIFQTLDYVLSGECSDELLQCLHLVAVIPAPNSSRLLVTVSADVSESEFDHAAIAERLAEKMGWLRANIAASINRKRVPLLAFQILPPQTISPPGE